MIKLLPRLLLIGTIATGGVYVAKQQHVSMPFAEKLHEPTKNVQGAFQDITKNVGEQTQQLSERTKDVSEHVQNVLGETSIVEENKPETNAPQSSEQPIHKKAIEYGQYMYCQQVVKDYEASN